MRVYVIVIATSREYIGVFSSLIAAENALLEKGELHLLNTHRGNRFAGIYEVNSIQYAIESKDL